MLLYVGHRTDILRSLGSPPPSTFGSIRAECGSHADHNLSAFILHTHTIPLLPMRGGGLQTIFLQTKARATAAGSPNESNEDDTTACLVFFVYLFADVGYSEAIRMIYSLHIATAGTQNRRCRLRGNLESSPWPTTGIPENSKKIREYSTIKSRDSFIL